MLVPVDGDDSNGVAGSDDDAEPIMIGLGAIGRDETIIDIDAGSSDEDSSEDETDSEASLSDDEDLDGSIASVMWRSSGAAKGPRPPALKRFYIAASSLLPPISESEAESDSD